jgi:hypothetical protein
MACDSLVTIADPDVAFPSLEVLQIERCQKLKKLPFDMAGQLAIKSEGSTDG